MELHKVQVCHGGKLYLDEFEVKGIKSFELKNPAGRPAELTITIDTIINSNSVDSESRK